MTLTNTKLFLRIRLSLITGLLYTSVSLSAQDPYPDYDTSDGSSNSAINILQNGVASTNPVGSIVAMAGSKRPLGYLMCDGRTVSRANFPQLFEAIGTTYGGNNTDFRLPDLRGYFLRGWDYDGLREPSGGRSIGSGQSEDFLSHDHDMSAEGRHRHQVENTGREDGGEDTGRGAGGGVDDTDTHRPYTNHAPDHDHDIYDKGGPETRPDNVAIVFYIKATSHEQTNNKFISGSVVGNRPSWLDYQNSKGLLVGNGNDNAFFGLKNRSGENGNGNDFNAAIYFGDNDEDNLIIEHSMAGELIEVSPAGYLRNQNIRVHAGKIDGDGIGGNASALMFEDNDEILFNSPQINIGQIASDEVTIQSGRLNILSDVYGRKNTETDINSVNFLDAVYVEADAGLTVKTIIRTQDIDITPGAEPSAPDYVFLPDYKLNTLDEIKQFIEENGHLPKIPSANQIAENGYSVNKMDFALLEKVEEITLYLMEARNEREQLKQENEMLKELIQELAGKISDLEKSVY